MSQGDQEAVEAAAWYARLVGGEVSGEDGVEFDAWLEASAGNRAAFAQASALMAEFDARAGDVLAELEQPARPRVVPHRRPSALRWMVPAGGFALAAGLALTVLPQIVVETQTTTFATAKGQHQHVVLADGSSVDLDAETKLTVAMSRGERHVTLSDGQAIFDVKHDANRPFVVAAGDRLIRDLGTQFDVKDRAGAITVTVARGRVEVEPAAAHGRAFVLNPGERLAIEAPGAQPELSAVDPQETFSWRSGRLVYRAQPLSDVVADLNRQFVEQTTLGDPELGKTPITGVIVLDNPQAVVARLSLMLPIKAVPSDQGLLLQRR